MRRPATGLATLLLAALVASSIFGSGGLLQLLRLQQERRDLGDQAFALLEKNDDLRRDILELRHSDRALERLARQELGLVREGEMVYRFRERARDTTTAAPTADGAVVAAEATGGTAPIMRPR